MKEEKERKKNKRRRKEEREERGKKKRKRKRKNLVKLICVRKYIGIIDEIRNKNRRRKEISKIYLCRETASERVKRVRER